MLVSMYLYNKSMGHPADQQVGLRYMRISPFTCDYHHLLQEHRFPSRLEGILHRLEHNAM